MWCEYHKNRSHNTTDCRILATLAKKPLNPLTSCGIPRPSGCGFGIPRLNGCGFGEQSHGLKWIQKACVHCDQYGHRSQDCSKIRKQPPSNTIAKTSLGRWFDPEGNPIDPHSGLIARAPYCARCLRLVPEYGQLCQTCKTSCRQHIGSLTRQDEYLLGKHSLVFDSGLLPKCWTCDKFGMILDKDYDVVMAFSTVACAKFPISAVIDCYCRGPARFDGKSWAEMLTEDDPVR